MEVVKWTFWDDERYPNSRVSWDRENEYEAAIIRKIPGEGISVQRADASGV